MENEKEQINSEKKQGQKQKLLVVCLLVDINCVLGLEAFNLELVRTLYVTPDRFYFTVLKNSFLLVPVSETYLQQESSCEDGINLNGDISNATSTSTSSNNVAIDESFDNDILTTATAPSTSSEVVVVATKSKSKMFFNFGTKKDKFKDIL